MKTTKEEILLTSLRLFAEQGYEAVSTGMIAAELGITKGALYRHFESKQQIYDSIVEKMFELDASRAEEDHVPEKTFEEDPQSYEARSLSDFCAFTNHQLLFWTQHPFASAFRRMITIEQYRSEEDRKRFSDIIGMGPVAYTEDLLRKLLEEGKLNEAAARVGARNLAFQLFAPLKLAIELYDGGTPLSELQEMLRSAVAQFETTWTAEKPSNG